MTLRLGEPGSQLTQQLLLIVDCNAAHTGGVSTACLHLLGFPLPCKSDPIAVVPVATVATRVKQSCGHRFPKMTAQGGGQQWPSKPAALHAKGCMLMPTEVGWR